MGEYKMVYKEFAETKLVSMAKYRNRLVHFYAEIEPQELHGILQNDLDDFEAFLSSIKNVLTNPKKFGLRIA